MPSAAPIPNPAMNQNPLESAIVRLLHPSGQRLYRPGWDASTDRVDGTRRPAPMPARAALASLGSPPPPRARDAGAPTAPRLGGGSALPPVPAGRRPAPRAGSRIGAANAA